MANLIEFRKLFSAIGTTICDTFLHFGTTGVNMGILISAVVAAAAAAVVATEAESVAVQTGLTRVNRQT